MTFDLSQVVSPKWDDPEVIGEIQLRGQQRGWLKPREAALYLGLHPQTLLRRIKEGQPAAYLVGKRYRITWPHVVAYKTVLELERGHTPLSTFSNPTEQGEQDAD